MLVFNQYIELGDQQQSKRQKQQEADATPRDHLEQFGLAPIPFLMMPAHASRKAFPDQPRCDQHHALDAEGDHQGKEGFFGEVPHAVPSCPTRSNGQNDTC